jgi:CAAX protease family protein
MISFNNIFYNKHGELRVGWRFSLFLSLTALLVILLDAPFKLLEIRSDFLGSLGILLATLGSSYVITRFVNKKPIGAIGLSIHPKMFREFGAGCLLGVLMLAGVFLIELMAGFTNLVWRGLSLAESVRIVVYALLFFSIAAFEEELLFRGYAFQTLVQWITFFPAMLVISVLFAISHLANPHSTIFSTINVGLAGMWLSIAYMKTRSLWLPFGLHVSWNFAQTTLFGYPTSGISFPGLRIWDSIQTGPEWITGGAFGPEGGILATIALVASTWYVLKSSSLLAPEGIVTLDSVEDLLPKQSVSEDQS